MEIDRIALIGTPAEVTPHLIRIAEELKFQGFNYRAYQIRNESGQLSREFEILCGEHFGPCIRWLDDQMDQATRLSTFCIGTITLQPLPNSRTLIIIRKQEPTKLENAELYFNGFLDKLSTELKKLGFLETWPRKAWRVIKELIGIAKAVKP